MQRAGLAYLVEPSHRDRGGQPALGPVAWYGAWSPAPQVPEEDWLSLFLLDFLCASSSLIPALGVRLNPL